MSGEPSIFEAVAQEGLDAVLREACQFIARTLSLPQKGFSEAYTAVQAVLQWAHLRGYSASLTEAFYGLHRVSAATGAKLTQSEMVRSLACLTLLPYLRQRLHDLFLEMENSSWTLRTFYPSFYCLLHLVDLACQVLYSLGLTSAHSPYLYLAGVRLRSGGQQSGMALGRLLAIIAFLLQFLRTWYARPEGAPSLLALRSPGPPSKLPGLPRVCPLCKKSPAQPTVLPVSGVVFCQECILDHLSSHPFCPVTRYPRLHSHLPHQDCPVVNNTHTHSMLTF
ncbi:PEX12 [Cordylochernes scorpioides]|uniref:Peroxisome assembly protein 12 n=1 Tax=Cordylochernes scorpioides TaxID=51811 RepID=A0ABY6KKT4_9ARAC|nr:PEX12 [Cordylochernes scorpioides]